jgi:Asp-tRNA(Asn)/Glu-tRNA(Gln) amidotransferase A subunit family amidase
MVRYSAVACAFNLVKSGSGSHVRPAPGSDLTKVSRNYALSRSKGFGPEVKKRILLGTYALTAEWVILLDRLKTDA